MEAFRKIFTGLMRAHGCTYVDKKGADGLKIKGKSFVKREPVTDKLWEDHLNGIEPSLGIIPINEQNECRWGCIDVDKYNLDHKQLLNKLPMGVPLWVCRSKSGGAHIFLFTTDFVPAKLMRDKLMSLSAVLGFGNAEVFPKQIELKSQDDTGNFLNLPYFNYKNTTRYCFDSKGQAIKIDAFLNSVEVGALTPKELQDLKIERPPSEFDDGPPCLESLTKEKLDDGRDRVMFQFRVYARKKWPDSWTDKLDEFNYKHFVNPFRHDEISKFRKDNKDYGFKCTEQMNETFKLVMAGVSNTGNEVSAEAREAATEFVENFGKKVFQQFIDHALQGEEISIGLSGLLLSAADPPQEVREAQRSIDEEAAAASEAESSTSNPEWADALTLLDKYTKVTF